MEDIRIDYLPLKLIELLEKKKLTLSTAESCSGGLLSHFITNIDGISKFFKGGIICYSNESKINLLKVETEILKKYGSVSLEVTEAIARNVRNIFSSDIGIGITCYASQHEDIITLKGLSFISIASASSTKTFRKKYKGSRVYIKSSIVKFALEQLINVLKQ
ncbi:MAG: CinA family protein [Planctomycetota bacterium]